MDKSYKKHVLKCSDTLKISRVYGYNVGEAFSKVLHADNSMTLAYFMKGRASIKIEGSTYYIESGDAVILNYDELHRVEIDKDIFCDRISILFTEQLLTFFPTHPLTLLDIFQKRERGKDNLLKSHTLKESLIDAILNDISNISKEDDDLSKTLCICKTIELLHGLNRILKYESKSNISPSPVINTVLEHINQNFTKDLTCESIAKTVHINHYYLERIFKKSVGMSLWDYIISRRLIYCNELIKQGYTVKQASFSSGFNNYSNFYRLYKKHTGTTPLEFKKSTKGL